MQPWPTAPVVTRKPVPQQPQPIKQFFESLSPYPCPYPLAWDHPSNSSSIFQAAPWHAVPATRWKKITSSRDFVMLRLFRSLPTRSPRGRIGATATRVKFQSKPYAGSDLVSSLRDLSRTLGSISACLVGGRSDLSGLFPKPALAAGCWQRLLFEQR